MARSLLHTIRVLFFSLLFSEITTVGAQSGTDSSAQPLSTACGDIIAAVDDDVTANFFWASDAYDCLSSVPLNTAVAFRFLDYYNTTLQFQSTLAFLKNPTSEYQQPAIDVQKALQDIRQNLTAGYYSNQYDFEATVQALVYRVHDYHVSLSTGILSAFSFGSPYDIMSISVDGKQAPEVYILDDIMYMQSTRNFTPSPIKSINGQDTISYLTAFAADNSYGLLEPHADWNQLMYTPVQDILGLYDTFGWQVTLYPGDSLNLTFANGTELDTYWLAIYQNLYRTGPLTTGGDFYNYFVLGNIPASFTGPETRPGFDNFSESSPAQTSWYNFSAAYPAFADVFQPDLSLAGGGFLTGYFLNASSTAVLSIPSFQEYGDAIGTFSNTSAEFISRAQDAGLTRVVLDLQQNIGGATLLAFDMFNQFFPSIDPYAGSRRRSFDLANALGAATTDWWDSLSPDSTEYDYSVYHDDNAADEWVITDRINAATGRLFRSWEEYQGPILVNGDTFSLVERYNLSDPVFDSAAFDGYEPSQFNKDVYIQPPFPAENIVILTDATCSSTCAIFVELMTRQAGVRTVVVGGLPKPGPMQAVAGSRGASAYSAEILDVDFETASSVNTTAMTILPQNRDSGMVVTFAGFNLRDQVRSNDTTPLQFRYEAADCRIYYTFANAYNLTRLWLDAATAIFDDHSLCVAGSTGYTSSNSSIGKPAPPAPSPSSSNTTFEGITSSNATRLVDLAYIHSLTDGKLASTLDSFTLCNSRCGPCVSVSCSDKETTVSLCPLTCYDAYASCGSGLGTCTPFTNIESKSVTVKGQSLGGKKVAALFCRPEPGASFNGCPNVNAPANPNSNSQ